MESLALTFLVYAVLLSMLIVAMSAALRSFGHKPKKPQAKVPFVDFPPPPPVVLTPAVKTVGTLTLLWMLLNALVAVYWLTNPVVMPYSAESLMIAVYIIVASFYGCLGGILLLAGVAQGRRMTAWSGFLFITIMILGLGFTLLLAGSPVATGAAKFAGKIGAVVVFFHLIVDGLLGHAAQTVGLAAEPTNIKE